MQKILYFDYCAFIVLCIILVIVILKGMTKGRLNKAYFYLLICAFFATYFDIAAVTFDVLYFKSPVLRYGSHTLYLFMHTLSALLYVYYIICLTDTFFLFKKSKLRTISFLAPFVVLCILYVENFFSKKLFYIDDSLDYVRGQYFIVLYVLTLYYVIYGFYYLVKFRRVFDWGRFIPLLSDILFLIVALLIQYKHPNLLVEMFASAIGLIFIQMMVQRPEEIIDSDTNLNKLSLFVEDLKRSFINKKHEEIVMFNIVNYKVIRDMLGYNETKLLKRNIGAKILEVIESSKMNAEVYYADAGRYRIVMSIDNQGEDTKVLAEKINEEIKKDYIFNNMNINIIACTCIVNFPEDIDNVDDVIKFGDNIGVKEYTGEVLYATELFKKDEYNIMRDIDEILENAVNERKFKVVYQPIYSVETQKFSQSEALVRLNDEKYGNISPAVFIPVAEKNGTINKIGEIVMEEVCKFVSSEEFRDSELEYIEVNLSIMQCMNRNLVTSLMNILSKYDVKPKYINLEITETATASVQDIVYDNINKLWLKGFRFSLDDFGTGYSNIARLSQLPFSIIKFDRTLTMIGNNDKLNIIIKNLMRAFKETNAKIVVEGIEDKVTLDQFTSLGCDYIQGFYFSKPLPLDDFVSFIKEKNM